MFCFFFDRMESLKPQAVWLQSSSLCTPSLRLPASAPQVCWDGGSMGWKYGKNGGFVGISWEYNGNIVGMAMQWKIYCTGIKDLLGGMWPLVVKSRESRTVEGASLETRLVRPPWKAEGETWITHTSLDHLWEDSTIASCFLVYLVASFGANFHFLYISFVFLQIHALVHAVS